MRMAWTTTSTTPGPRTTTIDRPVRVTVTGAAPGLPGHHPQPTDELDLAAGWRYRMNRPAAAGATGRTRRRRRPARGRGWWPAAPRPDCDACQIAEVVDVRVTGSPVMTPRTVAVALASTQDVSGVGVRATTCSPAASDAEQASRGDHEGDRGSTVPEPTRGHEQPTAAIRHAARPCRGPAGGHSARMTRREGARQAEEPGPCPRRRATPRRPAASRRAVDHTRTTGRSCSRMESPMPVTSPSSSTDRNGPFANAPGDDPPGEDRTDPGQQLERRRVRRVQVGEPARGRTGPPRRRPPPRRRGSAPRRPASGRDSPSRLPGPW